MNFVQSISEEDEQLKQRTNNRDFVHVLLIKNNTFVTVTDARGNKKTGASAGCLEERKGRSRLSRYAAEATAEHVGRSARKMGVKSVVMKVKGATYFRKKKKVILSWREGFRECSGASRATRGLSPTCRLAQCVSRTGLFCYHLVWLSAPLVSSCRIRVRKMRLKSSKACLRYGSWRVRSASPINGFEFQYDSIGVNSLLWDLTP
ncbi:hypothetical protein GW17_00029825 [Ensete ventricosum]|nr:hypothetical protein GW17_00029825 [Ensete ventricosum]